MNGSIGVFVGTIEIPENNKIKIEQKLKTKSVKIKGTIDIGANEIEVRGNIEVEETGSIKTTGTIRLIGTAGNRIKINHQSVENIEIETTGEYKIKGRLEVIGTIKINQGTLRANTEEIKVGGNWINRGTFEAEESEVILNGIEQRIEGTNKFYKLTKETANGTIIFEEGKTQTITSTIKLKGESGKLLKLISSKEGSLWRIDPQGGREIEYVNVKDSENSNATRILPGQSINEGNVINWFYGIGGILYQANKTTIIGNKKIGVSIDGKATEIGHQDTTDNQGNYYIEFNSNYNIGSLLAIYIKGETEKGGVITKGTLKDQTINIYQEHLIMQEDQGEEITNEEIEKANNGESEIREKIYNDMNGSIGVFVGTIEIPENNKIKIEQKLKTKSVKIEGTIDIGANEIEVRGNIEVEETGSIKTTGTIRLIGTAGNRIKINHQSVENIEIETTGEYKIKGKLEVTGTIKIKQGTLRANTEEIKVGGNWINRGIFEAEESEVILNGIEQRIEGTNKFYRLTKETANGTIIFEKGKTQTITNTIKLKGESGKLLKLRSSKEGSLWRIDPQGGREIEYVNVKDSENSNSTKVLPTESINEGNVINWFYGIGGKLYQANKTTIIGNKKIGVSIDGKATEIGHQDTTDNQGNYYIEFNSNYNIGSLLAIYIKGETQRGGVITKGTLKDQTIDIYQEYLIMQEDQGEEITNEEIEKANNGESEIREEIYNDMNGSIGVMVGTIEIPENNKIKIEQKLKTKSVKIRGTIDIGANEIEVRGNIEVEETGSIKTTGTIRLIGTAGNRIKINHQSVENIEIETTGEYKIKGKLEARGIIKIKQGTLRANTEEIKVGGNWINEGKFISETSEVILNGQEQRIEGTNKFYRLTKETANGTIIFEKGKTQTITSTIKLKGESGKLLKLISSKEGSLWRIDPQGGREIEYVNVKDSFNSNLLRIHPENSINAGNIFYWFYIVSGTLYQDKGITVLGNKNIAVLINGQNLLNGHQDKTDNKGEYHIELSSGYGQGSLLSIYINNEIEKGVMVTESDGNDLKETYIYQNNLIIKNDNTGIVTNQILNGARNSNEIDITDIYDVNNNQLIMQTTIGIYVPYLEQFIPGYDIRVNRIDILGTLNMNNNIIKVEEDFYVGETGGINIEGTLELIGTQNFNIQMGEENILGNMLVNAVGGDYTMLGDIDLEGTLFLKKGYLRTGGNDIYINRDWVKEGGTFIAELGTVYFDGESQTILGEGTFYNIYKVLKSTQSGTFYSEVGKITTITGTMTLKGSGTFNLLYIRSTQVGKKTYISPDGGRDTIFLDVNDSYNVNLIFILPPNSVEGKNQRRWFPKPRKGAIMVID